MLFCYLDGRITPPISYVVFVLARAIYNVSESEEERYYIEIHICIVSHNKVVVERIIKSNNSRYYYYYYSFSFYSTTTLLLLLLLSELR